MKVTALISEELIEEVKAYTGGKNITESITIALKEFISQKKINEVMDEVAREPLILNEEAVEYLRAKNRNR
ncbi:MAG: DUF2191 domain-containing protein [Cyclobacteriaceae bacterium]